MHSENSSALPVTELENPRTTKLSSLSTSAILKVINEEDALVAQAVARTLPEITQAVEKIVSRLSNGGRLFYIGTGTSGRLGILDASECPPTFGVSSEMVQGIIAGGYEACYRAVEASEDDGEAGAEDLKNRQFSSSDVLVGIAASGRTPYTVGAVSYARALGAFTIALTSVPDSPITKAAELSIVPVVGPEVIAGSTRMKAGTAQKLVLNMLSTASMVKLGYVTGNRMTNVQTRNVKLRDRAVRILMAETKATEAEANATLHAADEDLRVALVMISCDCSPAAAREALAKSKNIVLKAIQLLKGEA